MRGAWSARGRIVTAAWLLELVLSGLVLSGLVLSGLVLAWLSTALLSWLSTSSSRWSVSKLLERRFLFPRV
ncbi:hypothetical protein CFRA_01495 [Corynebacterium frankenforstense DSM 45800]|uniref:Uncharacterized protein n=1 Tax=Corynebacterium frankenforstense DSM 45800 TaxID=1437875 RepID=A0A1L7CQS2_9CORY|nr:hypothetical protein CFRA_01495 [Corynebacterium frankenforstense DSM 45800]